MFIEGVYILNPDTPQERRVNNGIVSEGAEAFLKQLFLKEDLPDQIWIGLTGARFTFDEASLDRIAAGEPQGNGYIRHILLRGTDDFAVEQIGSAWRCRSKTITWTATENWTKVWTRMFLCNRPTGAPPPGAPDPVVYSLSGLVDGSGEIVQRFQEVTVAYEFWLRG